MHIVRFLVLLAMTLSFAPSAAATDGVLEINQACATKTGCFSGDDAGFPVTIDAAGSYRLTSSISVAKAGTTPIEITADRVSLDLNGFSVTFCVGVICGIGDPVSVIDASTADETRVFNGAIQGAPAWGIMTQERAELRNLIVKGCGNGISVGADSRVEAVTVTGSVQYGVLLSSGSLLSRSTVAESGAYGVQVEQDALIVESVIRDNDDGAIQSLTGTVTWKGGYRGCVITRNGSGPGEVIGPTMINLGGNVCGNDTVCP